MSILKAICAPLLLLVALASASPLSAEAAATDALKGATIRVVIAGNAGNGTDQYGRAILDGMKRVLPETTFLIQNVDGGGGSLALTEIEAASGRTIALAITNTGPIYNQLLGAKIAVDLSRFHWIGSITSNQRVAVKSSKTAEKSIADMLAADRQLVAVAAEAGSANTVESLAVSAMTGLDLRIVTGIKDEQRMTMILAGDADMQIGSYVNFRALIESGELVPVLQYEREADMTALAAVPTLRELVKDDEALEVVGLLETLNSLGRYILAAPGTDAATIEAVRAAFDAAAAAPETQKAFTSGNLVLAPVAGAEVQKRVDTFLLNDETRSIFKAFVDCGQTKSDKPGATCD